MKANTIPTEGGGSGTVIAADGKRAEGAGVLRDTLAEAGGHWYDGSLLDFTGRPKHHQPITTTGFLGGPGAPTSSFGS